MERAAKWNLQIYVICCSTIDVDQKSSLNKLQVSKGKMKDLREGLKRNENYKMKWNYDINIKTRAKKFADLQITNLKGTSVRAVWQGLSYLQLGGYSSLLFTG